MLGFERFSVLSGIVVKVHRLFQKSSVKMGACLACLGQIDLIAEFYSIFFRNLMDDTLFECVPP